MITPYPPATPIPASEAPTQRAIPRAPRVPADWELSTWERGYVALGRGYLQRPVAERRYDLEHATGYALECAGQPANAQGFHPDRHYIGLDWADARGLSEARTALIHAAPRLGGPP